MGLKLILISIIMLGNLQVFKFSADSNPRSWIVVLDGVMGGQSDGNFVINEEGYGIFSGDVSLENNGGFASLRHTFPAMDIKGKEFISIRVKGDGKKYQLRIKSNSNDRHSYISYFQTNGEWQVIDIPLKEMIPSFRGMKLSIPNFQSQQVEEVAFLIGNKKAESFQLIIDEISLK